MCEIYTRSGRSFRPVWDRPAYNMDDSSESAGPYDSAIVNEEANGSVGAAAAASPVTTTASSASPTTNSSMNGISGSQGGSGTVRGGSSQPASLVNGSGIGSGGSGLGHISGAGVNGAGATQSSKSALLCAACVLVAVQLTMSSAVSSLRHEAHSPWWTSPACLQPTRRLLSITVKQRSHLSVSAFFFKSLHVTISLAVSIYALDSIRQLAAIESTYALRNVFVSPILDRIFLSSRSPYLWLRLLADTGA